jgi:hypothetical protein
MSPIIPARPARDTRLDIIRGTLQLTIFASHVVGSFIGGWLIFGTWGLSDSSEQFVFLSGFTLGSVITRKSLRDGWPPAAADIWRRTWRLYKVQLLVAALYFAMVLLAGATILPGEAQRNGWGFLLSHPLAALPALATMLYQPQFMGILPVFIWCMLLLPGFAWMLARWGGRALLLPIAVYACVHLLSLHTPTLAPDTGIAFDLFAWQILYMSGAWLGRRALLHGRALPFDARWAKYATAAALAMVAFGVALRLDWYGILPGHLLTQESTLIVGKEQLALPRLLHALSLAWLVARFVPRESAWMHAAWAAAIARIGRYSLETFCLGLFLSWAGSALLHFHPGHLAELDPPIVAAGCLLMALFARFLDRKRTTLPQIQPA